MWCRKCGIETKSKICPICKTHTIEDTPTEVYWCDNCKVPILTEVSQVNKGICPVCGEKSKYMASDIRPVFPEERLLIEILLELEPNTYLEKSVWAQNHRYYINGRPISLSMSLFLKADSKKVSELLNKYSKNNNYEYFNKIIKKFVKTNKYRLDYIKNEASDFIREAVKKFPKENVVVSFSGGKDSTATADLVIKALSNPSVVHIFGDTTLEFPYTKDYAKRYRDEHPQAIFMIARNNEQKFLDVCEDIGPPARMMRWCCSMFKTGPITRVINSLYRNQQILTFYGIRKSESINRAKYNRIEGDSESMKIRQQTVASPIFFWKDMDVWLYLLGEDIDFNDAYRLGYDRVGCWCCPNNNQRAQFLSKIYMPEQAHQWRDFLISFAKKIGKPDPENYVDEGGWKARQGGNGLVAAKDVKIKFSNCTSEENAKIYRLTHPFGDNFLNFFIPFGRVAPELGQKLLRETIVIDVKTSVPILSIQPFNQDGYEYAVKIKTMNVADHDELQRMVGYQVRKFNACRQCLKCESLCKAGAISIVAGEYYINPQKCVHCKICMTAKYLDGGCTMDKYLRTK